ncbi:MAG TPA: c-type cytochrome [Burkholderiaceae bacterium]|nr:c-type cytochrome [Burkholderiaceae bacterium]
MSEHEPFIKTPKQLINVVILAFIVPIIVIVLLVVYVGSTVRIGAGSTAMTPEAIEARIKPVAGFVLRAGGDTAALRPAEEVYKAQCAACHEAGVAGSPKTGDTAAWAPRIKAGYEALLASALKGKGAMPPQGGGEYNDLEIGRAVVLMANKGGAKFQEPKAPEAAKQAEQGAPAGTAAPAAPVAVAPPVAASAAAATSVAQASAPGTDAGKKLYEGACQACHVAGVAGAPKIGDKAAWAPRIGQGIDALTASVVKGKGAMPPKGGSNASEGDIKAAVEYMVAASK